MIRTYCFLLKNRKRIYAARCVLEPINRVFLACAETQRDFMPHLTTSIVSQIPFHSEVKEFHSRKKQVFVRFFSSFVDLCLQDIYTAYTFAASLTLLTHSNYLQK
jgi:hypothetical protein